MSVLYRAAGKWIIFAMLGATCLRGAETAPAVSDRIPAGTGVSTNPPVQQTGPGQFQIGDVRLSQSNRSITFPAQVNLREGNIEYVVVTTSGKTHESLLRTSAEPLHLQLAFLLLGAKGAGTNALPENPAETIPGGKVEVKFSWTEAETRRTFRAEDFVLDRKAGTAAGVGPWIYTGSRLREDGFAAQLDGSIVSLITDADALINNPRKGREDDDNWLVRTNNLPPLHSPVEVTIRLIR